VRAGEGTRRGTDPGPPAALRVLIVEDEVLIALELEDMLSEAGYVPVGIAATASEAVRLGHDLKPDVALVDIHLADGSTGVDVARSLGGSDETAVVFMTANGRRIPPDFAGAVGAIGKPYSERSVTSALSYFAGRRDGRIAPSAAPPDGLVLSPRLRAAPQTVPTRVRPARARRRVRAVG
jgi:two-component system, response regulator PdtaR